MSGCGLRRTVPRTGRRAEDVFRREGMYWIEEAYIIPPEAPHRALALHNAVLDVEREREDRLIVHGRATVHNASLVNLLEDHETLDMILNMGKGFVFYLREPLIQAGKVFSPTVSSTLRFIPQDSFDHWSDDAYARFKTSLLPYDDPVSGERCGTHALCKEGEMR